MTSTLFRLAVVVAVALAAPAIAHAQPAITAAEHHERGKDLFRAQDFAGAAAEFSAAFELDPLPKYLYNLAQAQRFGDHCVEAIETYRRFLATNPADAEDVAFARTGIERCEEALPPPVTCGDGAIGGTEACDDHGTADGDGCSATCAIETGYSCAGAPSACTAIAVATRPTPPPRPAPGHRWDRLSKALIGASAGAAIGSGVMYLLARSEAKDTFAVQPIDDYDAHLHNARVFRLISAVSLGLGITFAAGAIIRYSTRSPPADITVVPTSGGAAVVVGGRF